MAEPDEDTPGAPEGRERGAGGRDEGAGDGKKNPPPGSPAAKQKEQRKQTIIAAAAILGVLIAWLSLKKGSSSTSASTGVAGGSIGAYTPSGDVAGSSSDSSALQGFQTLLSNQSQQLASLEQAFAGLSPTSSTASTTPQPLAQFDWGAPVVTGDINQDTAIEQSPYVAGLYAAYKKNPTKQTAATYQHSVNVFDAAKQSGAVNSGSLQITGTSKSTTS